MASQYFPTIHCAALAADASSKNTPSSTKLCDEEKRSKCKDPMPTKTTPEKKFVALRLGSGMSISISPLDQRAVSKKATGDMNDTDDGPLAGPSNEVPLSDDQSDQSTDDEDWTLTTKKNCRSKREEMDNKEWEPAAAGADDDDFQPLPKVYKARKKSAEIPSLKSKDHRYCPYKGCRSSPFIPGYMVFKHIRNIHDASFPKLQGQTALNFHTQSGKTIGMDGKSRNSLKKNERITVRSSKVQRLSPEKKGFFCPYKGCQVTQQNVYVFYRHIHQVHYSSAFTASKKRGKPGFKAPNGRIYCFNDETCRETLNTDDPIVIEKIK